jgi:NADH-quinone oxidoreductase subunit C
MNQALQDLGDYIKGAMPEAIMSAQLINDELVLIAQPQPIARILLFLRDDSNCLFKTLIDICGVDYPERKRRFDVVYHLLSLRHNQRIRIKLQIDDDVVVPSAIGVFSAAGWYEREAWDLYGIMFANHPDLRRLLTDYGFDGHPMRKDFPLTGFVEVRYDEVQKRVVYEPVALTQDFRSFDFTSPWEGTDYVLPGDEKAGPNDPGEGG